MELDVLVHDPSSNVVIHFEPSLDAHAWVKRETRFKKKFDAGKMFIGSEVFPWLISPTIRQVAIFPRVTKVRRIFVGAKVVTVDELIAHIQAKVRSQGAAHKNAIPEQFPLLRTIQFLINGYARRMNSSADVDEVLKIGAR